MIPEKSETPNPSNQEDSSTLSLPRRFSADKPSETQAEEPDDKATEQPELNNANGNRKGTLKRVFTAITSEGSEGSDKKTCRIDDCAFIDCSDHAAKTYNRIRAVVEMLAVEPNPAKAPIRLSLGDPGVAGLLSPHSSTLEALTQVIIEGKHNGYGPTVGHFHVREALARHVTQTSTAVTADDVILTSGCSHALQLAIEVLGNAGDNMLVPSPGFPLYETLMAPLGITTRFYQLMPEQNWEVNLPDLERRIDSKTRALILNNPSNPTGAVFSRSHLESLLALAARHRLPIITDEIYGDLVYGGAEFHPLASLKPRVPILCCDGISKRWLIPGWRLGWLVIHDYNNAFRDVRKGLWQLSTKIVGPSGVVQGALPDLLTRTPPAFFQHTRDILAQNAELLCRELSGVPGIRPARPSGAMYLMLLLDPTAFHPSVSSELTFTQGLIREESVFCLPSSAFHFPNAVRLVLTLPAPTLLEAATRIRQFCTRHSCAVLRHSLHSQTATTDLHSKMREGVGDTKTTHSSGQCPRV
jgi:tyrosine aminotransferase